jgi:hypothetical protein
VLKACVMARSRKPGPPVSNRDRTLPEMRCPARPIVEPLREPGRGAVSGSSTHSVTGWV